MTSNQISSLIARTKKLKKGKFGKNKKKQVMSKVQCFGCNEFRNFKRDCPKKHNIRKEISEAHTAEEKGEPENNPKKEYVKDIYY